MKVKRIKKEDLVKLKDGGYAVKVGDAPEDRDLIVLIRTLTESLKNAKALKSSWAKNDFDTSSSLTSNLAIELKYAYFAAQRIYDRVDNYIQKNR